MLNLWRKYKNTDIPKDIESQIKGFILTYSVSEDKAHYIKNKERRN